MSFSFGVFSGGDDPTGEATSEPEFIGMNSQIVSDLITKAGLIPNVVATPNNVLEEYKCIQAVIYERILALQKAVDYQLRYDPQSREVYYEPRGYIDNSKTLTVGTEIIGIPEWTETTDGMINNLRIDGATTETQITESGQIGVTEGYTVDAIQLTKTPNIVELYMDASATPTTQKIGGSKDSSTDNFYWIDREMKRIMPKPGTTFTTNHYAKINYSWSAPAPVQDFRQDSIDKYGEFQEVFTFNDISSVADAETRMENVLDKRSKPFLTGKIIVREDENIQVGEIVTIVDNLSVEQVNQRFVITKITRKYPSGFMEIEVGDKEWKLEDDIVEIENRVKRLEEQFIRNQDILLQLMRLQDNNLENAKTPEERYIKINKNTIDGNNCFILGHPTYGVLGTSRLGDEDITRDIESYMSNYGHYIEDFRDEDFKDDESTVWATEIFPPDYMVSKKITLNEKTIESCNVVMDNTGDWTLYLDNGNGWEEWTGNPHTFTSSGDYIRWKYIVDTVGSYLNKLEIIY